MEIHKPKPIHSWRELLTEIGVVVIGVGIALAAEQGVEWLHWHTRVAEARVVIATELSGNLQGAIMRLRTESCTERRLDQLAVILDGAGKSGSLPPVGDLGLPPRGLWWGNGAWESVVASQTATHFPSQQLAQISSLYKMIQRVEDFDLREIQDWRDLYTIVGPGRRLDAPSEAALRQVLSNARHDTRVLASLGGSVMTLLKGTGISFSRQDLAAIADAENQPLTQVAANGPMVAQLCGPIGAVPATYGQATLGHVRAEYEGARRTWPDFSSGPQ